jgi:anti-sigma factor RsiW
MNCRDFMGHFSSYLDGELEGTVLSESEAHLDICEKCSRTVYAYRQGIGQLPQLPAIEPPVDLYARVKQASGSSVVSIRPRFRRYRFAVPAAAAAIVVLALTMISIDTRNAGEFAYEMTPADSILDVISVQSSRYYQSGKRVQLASYSPIDDEPAFSYPVNSRPVFVLSGIAQAVE